jgi:pseudaminic acid cytidylyltransferase
LNQLNGGDSQVVVIIPARIGSKRIPKKNLQEVGGKSLLAITIQTAKKLDSLARVIVSTDSIEVASHAILSGAESPFIRSENLADDFSGTDAVVQDALDLCGIPDQTLVCCIYPTAVLLTIQSLEKGLQILKEHLDDLVLAVKPYSHPIDRALEMQESGELSYRTPEFVNHRTQDLPVSYFDAGQFYWATAESWRRLNIGDAVTMRPVVLSKYSAFDIDDPEDLEFVKQIFRFRAANE